MSGTRLALTSITVTAPDPRVLADFYARLLGAAVAASEPPRDGEPEEAGWAQVRTDGLTVNFEYERHWQAPVWPAEPGRSHATQHLDIRVDDLDLAVAHAVEQGARLADFQPQDDVRVLFDPAGHPFCLFL
jgi:catechol 2,3-dioxygenase-like lactoylglutathione lyase family enzyme